MAGRLQHAGKQLADLDDVAMADAQIDIGNRGRLVMRRDHPAAILLFEFGDRADMVVVMMGDQNVGQGPAGSLELADDRTCFGRVDRRGGAGGRVMDQIAEIVGQAGEDADVGGHDVSVGGTWAGARGWRLLSEVGGGRARRCGRSPGLQSAEIWR